MSFSQIRGLDASIEVLKSALECRRIPASYLFLGPEGIGKSLVARTFAKAVNCLDGAGIDSCDKCVSCRKIDGNNHPDVHLIPPAGQPGVEGDSGEAIKIEHIRELQDSIYLRPYEGKYKVFIIDNAHLLTPDASNAFLKTLEEPPANSLIILVTSKPKMLLTTIVSRCQKVRFPSLPKDALERMLRDEHGLDGPLSHYLAYSCEGRIGRALRLKGADVLSDKNAVIDYFLSGYKASGVVESFSKDRMRESLGILADWLRDVYYLKVGMPYAQLINLDRKNELLSAASRYSFTDLDSLFKMLCDTSHYLDQNINPRLLLNNMRLSFNG
jgi:DNA polymerase-3 subunit delta'